MRRLLGIELPMIQAPMAGANLGRLAAAVSGVGALGSIPCGMLEEAEVRREVDELRGSTTCPFNLNFFCHEPPERDTDRIERWLARLRPYYDELGLIPQAGAVEDRRRPFDDRAAVLVEDLRPPVVSFHYGLPPPALLARVKATGAAVLGTATTVEEAVWLEQHGADAVIAQGWEAGGHRGMFLTDSLDAQAGTLPLVAQVLDAVRVPVISAGGIGDARGIAACLTLGASGVQLGTTYLGCPEATTAPVHRLALAAARPGDTCITNVLTGRPARGLRNRLVDEIGPLDPAALPFPLGSAALAPLRTRAEAEGRPDFSPLWCGQHLPRNLDVPAAALTRTLASEALDRLASH